MFFAHLNEGIIIKKLIESIKDIVLDINLNISINGIELKRMNSSHSLLVDFTLAATGFDQYRCQKDDFILGLSVEQFFKILKCLENEDSLTLSCENQSKLKIKFENNSKKKNINIFFRNKKES